MHTPHVTQLGPQATAHPAQATPQAKLAAAGRSGARQAKLQAIAAQGAATATARAAQAQQRRHAAHVAPRTLPQWAQRMGRMPTL